MEDIVPPIQFLSSEELIELYGEDDISKMPITFTTYNSFTLVESARYPDKIPIYKYGVFRFPMSRQRKELHQSLKV